MSVRLYNRLSDRILPPLPLAGVHIGADCPEATTGNEIHPLRGATYSAPRLRCASGTEYRRSAASAALIGMLPADSLEWPSATANDRSSVRIPSVCRANIRAVAAVGAG
jgi:hypothetical protein